MTSLAAWLSLADKLDAAPGDNAAIGVDDVVDVGDVNEPVVVVECDMDGVVVDVGVDATPAVDGVDVDDGDEVDTNRRCNDADVSGRRGGIAGGTVVDGDDIVDIDGDATERIGDTIDDGDIVDMGDVTSAVSSDIAILPLLL